MAKWTPEQRAKFAATMARKYNKNGNLPEKETPQNVSKTRAAEAEHIAYLFGRFENEIEHYSRSNNIPFAALAEGVGAILQRQASR